MITVLQRSDCHHDVWFSALDIKFVRLVAVYKIGLTSHKQFIQCTHLECAYVYFMIHKNITLCMLWLILLFVCGYNERGAFSKHERKWQNDKCDIARPLLTPFLQMYLLFACIIKSTLCVFCSSEKFRFIRWQPQPLPRGSCRLWGKLK